MEKTLTVILITISIYLIWKFSRGPVMEMMMNYIDKQHTLSHRLMDQSNELISAYQEQERRIKKLEEELRRHKEEPCHTK